jgi:two-component system, OmpR family, phosphate regulon sensor histidine kinase PhoR
MFEERTIRLNQYQDKKELINALVDEAIDLTGSKIGYFAVLNETEDVLTMLGWSKTAMDVCGMMDKPIIYPVEQTGLWGDCVRQRQPVITNDYENSESPTKKGYPDDHVQIKRHINVAVQDGKKLVGILGVGNKAGEYTPEDAQTLQEFADQTWKIVQARQ